MLQDDKFGIFFFKTCFPRCKTLYIRLSLTVELKPSTSELSYDVSTYKRCCKYFLFFTY